MGVTSSIVTGTARTAERLAAVAVGRRSRLRVLVAPLGLTMLAFLLVVWATPDGLGVSPDTTQYLSASQHLRSGDGLRVHWWEEGTEPLTHFPPGQVVALATLESAGLTSDTAARLLNSTALLAIAVLAFGLASRAGNGSTTVGVAGAASVVLARDVLAANAMIWTEPLYLALMLGALLATARAIERDSWGAVGTAAVLAGVAGLVRYVVPALIAAIALSLLLLGTAPRARKFLRAGLFVLVAAIPTVLLYAFNASQGADAANRQLAFHPPSAVAVLAALRTAYHWFVPLHGPVWLELLLYLVLALAVMVLVMSLARSWREVRTTATADARQVRLMLALVVVCYVAFLYTALTLVDAQSTPDPRLMLPVVPPLAILIVAKLADLMRAPSLRRPALVMTAALSLCAAASVATWAMAVRRDGLGYNSRWWRTSSLMAAVRQLDPGTIVYSNHPGAILYQTGREVPGIPRLANPNSLQPNAAWASQMSAICERAAQRRIAYVHFVHDPSDWFLPSLSEVRRRWHSQPGLVTPQGVMDTIPATCALKSAN